MATWQPARRRPSNTMGTPRSRSHARARNTSSSVPTSNAKWLRLLAATLALPPTSAMPWWSVLNRRKIIPPGTMLSG